MIPALATLLATLGALVGYRPPPLPPAPLPSTAPQIPQEPRNEPPKVITLGIPPASGSEVTSTAYCLTGHMADGTPAEQGAVASNCHPLGTTLDVSDSPWGPGTFVVRDRIGWGSQLDFATAGDCPLARRWGRRPVSIVVH